MKILRQVLGVDVSQKELVVCLGRLNEDFSIELYSHRVFANRESGFNALHKWLIKNTVSGTSLRIVMEATGIYHQKFAHFMKDQDLQVSIVLPNKISNYMRTLDTKTVTDKTCSEAIARFGLERKLDDWVKPDPTYHKLQQLTRERDQIIHDRTMAKNRLHAENNEAFPNEKSIDRAKARIKLLNEQEKEVWKEIKSIIKENESVKEEVKRISTIPGVGELTAVIILAETNGFELIRNKKQLTSYAGMDVKEKQSGTSVKGKAKLSKRGNRYLRKAMYLPSLSAVKYNPTHKDLYERLVDKHAIKMKSLVAVQRKILELSYILWKNKSVYNPEYEKEKRAAQNDKLSLKLA